MKNLFKKSTPKISVIITCYNYGEFIDEAIQSVEQQSFKDYEIIIIDDCSTDEFTKARMCDIPKQYPHKVIALKKNVGVAKARNIAIEQARGEYIICLDSDDILVHTCLKKMYNIIKLGEYDIVGSFYKKIGADTFNVKTIDKFDKYKICIDNQIPISSLFKKKDWKEIGGFRENMEEGREDYDFWLGLIQNGSDLFIINEYLLSARSHQKRNSRDDLFHKDKDIVTAVNQRMVKNNYKLYYWFIEQQKLAIRELKKGKKKIRKVLYISVLINVMTIIALILSKIPN